VSARLPPLPIELIIALLVPIGAAGEMTVHVSRERTVDVPGGVQGAAFVNATLYTWGSRLIAWTLPDLAPQDLAQSNFGEGGCLTELDGDGKLEFVGYEGRGLGQLLWRRPPQWRAESIDTGIEMHDCREATLFGMRGVVMVNRHMQVRFYQRPNVQSGPNWPYREIYSFYTNSQQAGLVLNDVDGDGLVDILCGNYWIQSPSSFDLPWRLFAINTHHHTPLAAMVRFAPLSRGRLWIQQSHETDARAMLFERPADPKQLWEETLYGKRERLMRPHGLAAIDLDSDGDADVLAGEHNGSSSRLFLFEQRGKYFQPSLVAEGSDILEIFATAKGQFVTVGSKSVVVWSYRRRK
jgi:hypothetical protein